jgi:hypothetical protein
MAATVVFSKAAREDSWRSARLEDIRVPDSKGVGVEDKERRVPDAEATEDVEEDVEAHRKELGRKELGRKELGVDEEPTGEDSDVEAHRLHPPGRKEIGRKEFGREEI